MQLQCLEVPRSVEVYLKTTRRPKTKIHFPNPDTLDRLERTTHGATSGCKSSKDATERITPYGRPNHFQARTPAARQGFSDEDVLDQSRSDDSVNSQSSAMQRVEPKTLRLNQESWRTEGMLRQERSERPLSANDSCGVLDCQGNGTLSSWEASAAIRSRENFRPKSVRASRPRPQSRKNNWGGSSYTDLITAAIESSPQRRMSLAQIYEWIVKNVPYFKDKERYLSVQGWKNTVRHTLSIRKRFVRIKDPKRPYRSMWTVGEEQGSRRTTQSAARRAKPRLTAPMET